MIKIVGDQRPLYQRVMAGEQVLEYGLLGRTLAHSHSPAIHAALGTFPYDLVEVPPEDVRAFLDARAFKGLNVTIPYKFDALQAADEASDVAVRMGNANTLLVRPDGTLWAHNTDYEGFQRTVESLGIDVADKVMLVLGTGGAAHTVTAVLEDMGASQVVGVSRSGDLTYGWLRGAEGAAFRRQVSLIVNATPVGMYPHADDEPLVDLRDYPGLEGVIDVVYNPLATRILQQAADLGIPHANGLLMLVSQARASSDAWLGTAHGPDVDQAVYANLSRRLGNVVLIGMPGCGKSTTGSALAALMGWELVDVDTMIAEAAGKPISDIFAQDGEEEFRRIETECTWRACARSGVVVSCGGGVVTRERNRCALRQNGPVVLLTRGLDDPSEELTDEGRPLSQSKGVDALRRERAPLYHAWADYEVGPDADGPRATARAIADLLRSRQP